MHLTNIVISLLLIGVRSQEEEEPQQPMSERAKDEAQEKKEVVTDSIELSQDAEWNMKILGPSEDAQKDRVNDWSPKRWVGNFKKLFYRSNPTRKDCQELFNMSMYEFNDAHQDIYERCGHFMFDRLAWIEGEVAREQEMIETSSNSSAEGSSRLERLKEEVRIMEEMIDPMKEHDGLRPLRRMLGETIEKLREKLLTRFDKSFDEAKKLQEEVAEDVAYDKGQTEKKIGDAKQRFTGETSNAAGQMVQNSHIADRSIEQAVDGLGSRIAKTQRDLLREGSREVRRISKVEGKASEEVEEAMGDLEKDGIKLEVMNSKSKESLRKILEQLSSSADSSSARAMRLLQSKIPVDKGTFEGIVKMVMQKAGLSSAADDKKMAFAVKRSDRELRIGLKKVDKRLAALTKEQKEALLEALEGAEGMMRNKDGRRIVEAAKGRNYATGSILERIMQDYDETDLSMEERLDHLRGQLNSDVAKASTIAVMQQEIPEEVLREARKINEVVHAKSDGSQRSSQRLRQRLLDAIELSNRIRRRMAVEDAKEVDRGAEALRGSAHEVDNMAYTTATMDKKALQSLLLTSEHEMADGTRVYGEQARRKLLTQKTIQDRFTVEERSLLATADADLDHLSEARRRAFLALEGRLRDATRQFVNGVYSVEKSEKALGSSINIEEGKMKRMDAMEGKVRGDIRDGEKRIEKAGADAEKWASDAVRGVSKDGSRWPVMYRSVMDKMRNEGVGRTAAETEGIVKGLDGDLYRAYYALKERHAGVDGMEAMQEQDLERLNGFMKMLSTEEQSEQLRMTEAMRQMVISEQKREADDLRGLQRSRDGAMSRAEDVLRMITRTESDAVANKTDIDTEDLLRDMSTVEEGQDKLAGVTRVTDGDVWADRKGFAASEEWYKNSLVKLKKMVYEVSRAVRAELEERSRQLSEREESEGREMRKLRSLTEEGIRVVDRIVGEMHDGIYKDFLRAQGVLKRLVLSLRKTLGIDEEREKEERIEAGRQLVVMLLKGRKEAKDSIEKIEGGILKRDEGARTDHRLAAEVLGQISDAAKKLFGDLGGNGMRGKADRRVIGFAEQDVQRYEHLRAVMDADMNSFKHRVWESDAAVKDMMRDSVKASAVREGKASEDLERAAAGSYRQLLRLGNFLGATDHDLETSRREVESLGLIAGSHLQALHNRAMSVGNKTIMNLAARRGLYLERAAGVEDVVTTFSNMAQGYFTEARRSVEALGKELEGLVAGFHKLWDSSKMSKVVRLDFGEIEGGAKNLEEDTENYRTMKEAMQDAMHLHLQKNTEELDRDEAEQEDKYNEVDGELKAARRAMDEEDREAREGVQRSIVGLVDGSHAVPRHLLPGLLQHRNRPPEVTAVGKSASVRGIPNVLGETNNLKGGEPPMRFNRSETNATSLLEVGRHKFLPLLIPLIAPAIGTGLFALGKFTHEKVMDSKMPPYGIDSCRALFNGSIANLDADENERTRVGCGLYMFERLVKLEKDASTEGGLINESDRNYTIGWEALKPFSAKTDYLEMLIDPEKKYSGLRKRRRDLGFAIQDLRRDLDSRFGVSFDSLSRLEENIRDALMEDKRAESKISKEAATKFQKNLENEAATMVANAYSVDATANAAMRATGKSTEMQQRNLLREARKGNRVISRDEEKFGEMNADVYQRLASSEHEAAGIVNQSERRNKKLAQILAADTDTRFRRTEESIGREILRNGEKEDRETATEARDFERRLSTFSKKTAMTSTMQDRQLDRDIGGVQKKLDMTDRNHKSNLQAVLNSLQRNLYISKASTPMRGLQMERKIQERSMQRILNDYHGDVGLTQKELEDLNSLLDADVASNEKRIKGAQSDIQREINGLKSKQAIYTADATGVLNSIANEEEKSAANSVDSYLTSIGRQFGAERNAILIEESQTRAMYDTERTDVDKMEESIGMLRDETQQDEAKLRDALLHVIRSDDEGAERVLHTAMNRDLDGSRKAMENDFGKPVEEELLKEIAASSKTIEDTRDGARESFDQWLRGREHHYDSVFVGLTSELNQSGEEDED
ncbi:hypothetical protein FOL47_002240 [Perkinsus chesapeaki]|uniref:Uncharacterized protein n=1 Tax=Perkinsus chesapeaki TaxID=330153 RepID=A0A7J6N0B0_PERCH|nr:hypothetical protein FOL47_002240 [Perkinsus chesapeaki]